MEIRRKADVAGFVLRESVRSFIQHRGLEKAAVLAYNSFFALFAVFLLVLFIVGQVMASSQVAMSAVEQMASQLFPLGSDSVMREVRSLASLRVWGLLSLPILFWTVTPVASAIRGAFDQAYGRDRALPFLKERMLDAAAVLLLLLMMVALVIGQVGYTLVVSFLAGRLHVLIRAADALVPFMMAVFMLTFLHHAFTPGRARWGAALTGALVTALLLAVIGPLMTAVMRFNPSFGVAYGSLKTVFVLLLWVHYSFAAILIGIEVAANMTRREALLARDLFAAPERIGRHLKRFSKGLDRYEPGEVVFKEGDPGDCMFFVAEGTVRLIRGGQELRIMKSGEYFGEMALLLKADRVATAIACENGATLVSISSENMESVLAQNPRIVLALLREMAERLRATDAMIKD